jgi:peroxiredoxin
VGSGAVQSGNHQEDPAAQWTSLRTIDTGFKPDAWRDQPTVQACRHRKHLRSAGTTGRMALESEIAALERGEVAPDFDLDGADGETYSLDDFADGEAVLLVFTCNHCPYAVAKFDELNDLADRYDDVAVVGVNPNDAAEYPEDSFDTMVEYVEEGQIAYDAYLRDETQAVAQAYGATCTPDPFLLGRADGEFRLVYHGRLDDAMNPDDEPTDREMKGIIDRYLAGEAIDDEFKPSRGCSIKWRE